MEGFPQLQSEFVAIHTIAGASSSLEQCFQQSRAGRYFFGFGNFTGEIPAQTVMRSLMGEISMDPVRLVETVGNPKALQTARCANLIFESGGIRTFFAGSQAIRWNPRRSLTDLIVC